MPDNQTIQIDVETNIDSLSARAVHDCFVNLVRNELLMGEVALKALVPKRTMDMAAHTGHKGPVDGGIEIEGSVGIPEIHKSDESDPFSAKYPLFVDKGTGIFGEHGTIFSKEKQFMYIPPERGFPGFLRSSKGQPGKEFLFATFTTMVAMLKINSDAFKAELTAKLDADKLSI